MAFSITDDLGPVASRYAAGVPAQLLEAGVALIAESLSEPVKAAIAAETPVAPINGGTLQQSTDSAIVPFGTDLMLEVTQDAQSTDGKYYGQFVIHGHRIVAWGHDTGRMQPPDDYVSRGLADVAPEMDAALYAGAGKLALSVAAILA